MKLKTILKLTFIWRTALLCFAHVGMQILPFKDSFPYRDTVLEPFGSPLFYSWANFDGVHYLGIADRGYWAEFTQAFFPLYPLLIQWLNPIFNNTLFTGLFISHVSLVLTLHFLYKLIRLDFNHRIARTTIYLYLLFPTSFYFGSVYTESLFLFLVIGSFYTIRTLNHSYSILLAALASATRIIGIFLTPALLFEAWIQLSPSQRRHFRIHHLKVYFPYLISLSGLFVYMYFLNFRFSDPLYFLNAQPAFGAQRTTDKLILLYQVIYRYLKMFATVPFQTILYYTVSQEFFISIFFLILVFTAFFKLRKSYGLFAILSYILPTLTGTFSSMPRYVLVLFPAFIYLAFFLDKHPRYKSTYYLGSAILLAINTILFTRGYWVA